MVPKPAGSGAMTTADYVKIIGALKKSELEKSLCGKRLLAWYDTQRKVFIGN